MKLANYDVKQIDPLLRHTLLPTSADILATRSGALNNLVLTPQQIDDLTASRLARDIVRKIEEQLTYPGQIKVTVIRETRAVEYAK